jgi:hypothetical protein
VMLADDEAMDGCGFVGVGYGQYFAREGSIWSWFSTELGFGLEGWRPTWHGFRWLS